MRNNTLMEPDRLTPYGIAVLRVSLGIVLIAHALLKPLVFTMSGTAGFFESVGYPGWAAWPVFLVELVSGIMLVAGWQSRIAALASLPVLIGAGLVHAGNGWLFSAPNGGWEYPLFLAAAAIAVALTGDGAWSVGARRVSRGSIGLRSTRTVGA
jgi:putative oxidoreductase